MMMMMMMMIIMTKVMMPITIQMTDTCGDDDSFDNIDDANNNIDDRYLW